MMQNGLILWSKASLVLVLSPDELSLLSSSDVNVPHMSGFKAESLTLL